MAEYTIRMADERGHVLEQVELGNSEVEVRERFAQQGFLIYSVKPKGLLSSEVRLPRRRKVKQDQFVIFNQQFVTLIHAGLPIIQSIELLMKRQRNPFFRTVLHDVRDRVRGGALLSEAFAEQKVFPKVYTTTLLAGEKSGNLEEVLGRYIAFQRLAVSFRKKLVSSLVYPALLVVMLVVMLTFLITYVVPQFAMLYNQLGVELPPMTMFMLAIGTNAQRYAPYSVAALLIVGFLLWRWVKSDAGAMQMDRDQVEDAVAGRYLAEVPGGGVLPHVVDTVVGRTAAGARAGNRRRVDAEPPDLARHRKRHPPGARRAATGAQPGDVQRVSGDVGGDD